MQAFERGAFFGQKASRRPVSVDDMLDQRVLVGPVRRPAFGFGDASVQPINSVRNDGGRDGRFFHRASPCELGLDGYERCIARL